MTLSDSELSRKICAGQSPSSLPSARTRRDRSAEATRQWWGSNTCALIHTYLDNRPTSELDQAIALVAYQSTRNYEQCTVPEELEFNCTPPKRQRWIMSFIKPPHSICAVHRSYNLGESSCLSRTKPCIHVRSMPCKPPLVPDRFAHLLYACRN